ncbi:hypothetical protein [Streptomyces sp. CA-111067]|uniref:hypothetical protein n=1 Tax=Streptomyces sp. CA-111067 TaxID=3240046 RepID=UPI003D98EFA6
MKRTAALFVAAPVLLLSGACGSGDSGGTRHAAAVPVESSVSAAPAAVPSATATTADPAAQRRPEYEKITDEIKRGFQQAEIPVQLDRDTDPYHYCLINRYRIYPKAGHTRARESVVGFLRGEGWRSDTTAGTDETHLTRNGWDLFVTRVTDIPGDAGVPYESLTVSADCNHPRS